MLWLVLLAVPFQGFAAAAMLPCAPASGQSHHAAMTHAGHDMRAMHDHAMMQDHHGVAQHSHDSTKTHGHDADGKCASCAACCIGAAMAPALLDGFAATPPPSHSIPFRAVHVPSIHPQVLERPPSSLIA
jgi:hypothetical protein